MPYRFLDDVATADVAFLAWGETPEGLFTASAEATMSVMVGEVDRIVRRTRRYVRIDSEAFDLLLFDFLQELIFYKDAERLVLRVGSIRVVQEHGRFWVSADLEGEEIDPERHDLGADVKAVTLHRFRAGKIVGRWEAFVILDV